MQTVTVTDLRTLETRLVGPDRYKALFAMEKQAHRLAGVYRQAKCGTMPECNRLAWAFMKHVDHASPFYPAFLRVRRGWQIRSWLLDSEKEEAKP